MESREFLTVGARGTESVVARRRMESDWPAKPGIFTSLSFSMCWSPPRSFIWASGGICSAKPQPPWNLREKTEMNRPADYVDSHSRGCTSKQWILMEPAPSAKASTRTLSTKTSLLISFSERSWRKLSWDYATRNEQVNSSVTFSAASNKMAFRWILQ